MEIGEWIAADQYTGRIVRVVNSVVFKEPIFNYSTGFPFLWDEITIPVKYGSDHRLAREILQEVAHEVVGDYVEYAKKHWKHMLDVYFIEEAGLQPTIALTANDNWIEFALRYVVDYKLRRATKDKLFSRILDELEKTNGRVALASATFEIAEAPTIDVRVTQTKAAT